MIGWHQVAPVSEEPEIELTSWSIIKVHGNHKIFLGVDRATGNIRRSSPIVEFLTDDLAITESGRRYRVPKHAEVKVP